MERVSTPTLSFSMKSYWLLTKPGIILGNLITTAGGFALASQGIIDLWLFLAVFVGLGLVIASACVCNNYIDRVADGKMARTKDRPLARGIISGKKALFFALFLEICGFLCLVLWVNFLSVWLALFGFVFYVGLYSFSKYYSVHATLIGSIAGAIPPVVGYCAVSNALDLGALLFFLLVAFWQMPHFFAIAIYRLKQYAKASIPVLPLQKGIYATKVQMLLYLCAFIGVSFLMPLLGYVSYGYLWLSAVLNAGWLWLAIRGFKTKNDALWARRMFLYSLVVILGLCVAVPFNV